MDEPSVAPASAGQPFKDRRGGLVAFGILSILIGCVCALFVPLMFLGAALGAHEGQAISFRMIVPSVVVYLSLALAFVWLGIGSIMVRRWARTLLLLLAWFWLLAGILTTILMAVLMPQLLAASPPGGEALDDAARVVITLVTVGIMAVVMIALPAAFVFFYSSRHVKATCEARDPVPRWTDACPFPVLALSLGLAFAPVSMVSALVAYNSVIPFFGTFLTGAPALVSSLLLMATWIYCAWATYRLKRASWWIVTVGFVLLCASTLITLANGGLIEMYRAMGMASDQLEMMRGSPFLRGHMATNVTAAIMVPFIAYLIWIKRYFR